MRDRIETLQDRVKDQAKQQMMIKREREELAMIKQSLEARLTEALSKAEAVPNLEMEKKRLIEKEQVVMK
jgi:hypothetical protein